MHHKKMEKGPLSITVAQGMQFKGKKKIKILLGHYNANNQIIVFWSIRKTKSSQIKGRATLQQKKAKIYRLTEGAQQRLQC